MTKRKKKLLVVLGTVTLIVAALVPFPQCVDDALAPSIVSHALRVVVNNRRVLTNGGYRRLYDCSFVKADGRLYFENRLGIPDSIFVERGLKRIPADRKLDVDSGDIILSFAREDIEGAQTRNVQFSYIFGSLGAQGYEIKVYRSLLFRYIVYVHRWVS
jgi:hypothetical protein